MPTLKTRSLLVFAGMKLPAFIGALSLSFALTGIVRAQKISSDGIWQDVRESSIAVMGERQIVPKAYRTVRLNKDALTQVLSRAPLEFTAAAKGAKVIITLPKPDGTFVRFRIEESPIFAQGRRRGSRLEELFRARHR